MKKFYDIEIDSQVELENGKTLGKLEESKISVNDGNCGSGGGVMIVTVEYSEDDDGYVADKTFEEIKSAINSGMDIKCVLKDEGGKFLLNLSYYSFIDGGLK